MGRKTFLHFILLLSAFIFSLDIITCSKRFNKTSKRHPLKKKQVTRLKAKLRALERWFLPLHRVSHRFIPCDEYLNELLCQLPREASLPLLVLTGRFQGFLNCPLVPISVSSPCPCALDSPCCLLLLCPTRSPFSCVFLVSRGHMLLAHPASPPDSPLVSFPPPLLCTSTPEMTASPPLAGELMWTSRGLGVQPAHMPQAAPPSSAALPHASGTRFWKSSLQAGSLTLQGTLESPSFPLSIQPTLTLARLAKSATLNGCILLFCVFFPGFRTRGGGAKEWMPRGASMEAQKMVLYVGSPHRTLFQSHH